MDEYAVTDASGVATFENVLIGTGYTLEEIDTAERYVVPDSQTAAVEWNTVTNKSFSNILKKWNVTVTKSDHETGTAQGDASLTGAAYGIFKDQQLVDTYYTDEYGQFTTSYYVCGDDWTIRELSPSEGYLLDGTVYSVGAEAEHYTIERNSAPAVDVTEQVSKGSIAILKHTDNGETQIETPESGAEFAVYLKSAGSYEAAKDTERDYLVCDENGFAQTKDLPYGVYTVHQVSGWEGRELMRDFDVFVRTDGETYRYLINNANFRSFIKVVKVDAETGKAIPYAGAGFQIYRPDGSLASMTFTYPEVTTIDTFYTNAEGEEPSAAEAELAQEKYGALFEQNNDFVGWISIDETSIHYPVMQTPDNPDYYLKHGFDKAYSNYGVPYIDEGCAPGLSNNIVIYGHHMNDGTMFADLCGYADRGFYEGHKTIRFDTLSGFGEYEVVATFRFNTNRDTFRYNEYTNMDEAEFAEFLENVRARALYDTDMEVEYGDTLLTLSTCEYTYKNGRFVVVAKKVG